MLEAEQKDIGIERSLDIVRRRALWILLCFVLMTGLAYGYSKHQPKEYTATAAVAFKSNPLIEQLVGFSPATSGTDPVTQLNGNMQALEVGEMAAKTASRLDHGLNSDEVLESVTITPEGESNIVAVSAISTSPALAAGMANTYAGQFVRGQARANEMFLKAALLEIRRQLGELSPTERIGTVGAELQSRLQSLAFIAKLGYATPELVQEAAVPSSPSSPRTKRNTALGALLGLALGLCLAFALERFDRRIRDPSELAAIYSLPLLGVVPRSASLEGSSKRRSREGKALGVVETEAFNLINAQLNLFNAGRYVRTLAVASPTAGDGKSTVALHMAAAAARLGSRVLLLEADLRQPTLACQLDLPPSGGLIDVLTGAIETHQATQSISVLRANGNTPTEHILDFLSAGSSLPPNPGELLEGRAMEQLLGVVSSSYDLVVIDTPPLTAVADAYPLLWKVGAVVIVGRIGHTRRDTAERLVRSLDGSNANLIGVIANGSKGGGPTHYPGTTKAPPLTRPATGQAKSEGVNPVAKP